MASRLAKQLRRIRVRASQRGLPANLYVLSWRKTLEDFQGRCAYCGGTGWTIDHFTALASGGGSTIDNCVPSCWMCNNQKGGLSPESFSHRFALASLERIEQLRLYLQRRGAGLRGWPPPEVPRLKRTPPVTYQKKEECMTIEQTYRSKTALSDKREVRIYSSPSQIVLQLRHHKNSEDDLLNPVLQVAASLTPQECVTLSTELLRAASPLLNTPPVADTVSSESEDLYTGTGKRRSF